MLKRLLKIGFDSFDRCFFPGMPAESYKKALHLGLSNHARVIADWQASDGFGEALMDLQRATILADDYHDDARQKLISISVSAFARTIDALDGPVLIKGKLKANVAEIILAAACQGNIANSWSAFQCEIERLLLHVEVKRERSLLPKDNTIGPEGTELDRQRISQAFLHFGMQTHDVRFLSASLKMTDRGIKRKITDRVDRSSAKLLHCMAIQESWLQQL